MADLKAEQIMVAVQAKITGLSTTGSNVSRNRMYDIQDSELPYLLLIQGEDKVDGEFFNNIQIQSTFGFMVRAYIKQSTTIETTLNQIRKEIHIAVMNDTTLGLAFSARVFPVAASAPKLELAEKQYGYIDLMFAVRYTYKLTDASI